MRSPCSYLGCTEAARQLRTELRKPVNMTEVERWRQHDGCSRKGGAA